MKKVLGIYFVLACAKAPALKAPIMGGLPTQPGVEVAAAGPLSCAKVFTTPSATRPPAPLSPDAQTSVQRPVDLVIQVGGVGRSEACDDWLAQQQPNSAPSTQSAARPTNPEALWFGVMLGYGKSRAAMRADFDTIELQAPVTLAQMSRDNGAQLRIYNLDLRGESRATLMIQHELADFDAELNVLERNSEAPYRLSLHVIDARWRKAFAWRQAVPFLFEPRGAPLFTRNIVPGASLEGLFYPFRPSLLVDSFFLRALSISVGAGLTNDLNDINQRAMLLTAGLTWREFISVGYAFDLTEGEPRAPYVSLTTFSSAGVFGLIPYEEIRKALQQMRFSNQTQEPSSP